MSMSRFNAAVDIVAQTQYYPAFARVLAEKTVDACVRYSLGKSSKTEILLLLQFARALGFMEDEELDALQKYLPRQHKKQ